VSVEREEAWNVVLGSFEVIFGTEIFCSLTFISVLNLKVCSKNKYILLKRSKYKDVSCTVRI
jgi:hypothetical protein